MPRTKLFADPAGVFLHDAILASCRRFARKTAIVDTSVCENGQPLRVSYAEHGERVEKLARGMVGAGIRPGEVVAIFLCNGWEYAAAYHAATLAGAIPTLLNPSYREREVRYQLEASGAAMLITDAPQIAGMNLGGLPKLRAIYTTRHGAPGTSSFSELLAGSSAKLSKPGQSPERALAALPFSSGTTGMPKGVMLSHTNLVVNAYQFLAPGEEATPTENEIVLCFLPLYHIYGLNVILNPILMTGGTLVLMPRFDVERACNLITEEAITWIPMVPPVISALCHAAEQGVFPREHHVRVVKSGAAPLSPELPRRFRELTGIRVRQGYGMTEASPVTHMGYMEEELYRPDSIGQALALTDCRIVDESGSDVAAGEVGELVMRGPQFMLGYWNDAEETTSVLRDGWYWSGDVARRDAEDFYYIVDRRKELIKYKGFPIAPAEVEAVLLEHSLVRDCGVVGRADKEAGEIPVAFVVLRDSQQPSAKLGSELCGWVAERLVGYKQPREVRFVEAIPRNPSGKILRRELRERL